MRLIVVRHGETTHNAKKIIMGQSHGKLSPLGLKQVKLLGKALKKEKIDFIYCSDLKRCKDTLKEIEKFHKHVPVIVSKDLRERSFGVLEGRPRAEVDEAFKKYKGPPLKFKVKGGESLTEMRARISKFLKYLKMNHLNDSLLLVTHGGVLRILASILTKTSIQKLFKTVKFHNTAICEYIIRGSNVKVACFNDIKHLG